MLILLASPAVALALAESCSSAALGPYSYLESMPGAGPFGSFGAGVLGLPFQILPNHREDLFRPPEAEP